MVSKVPPIRNYYKFEDSLTGQAPHSDLIYAQIRRQDGLRKGLKFLEKEMVTCFTIEADPESASGYSVKVDDKKKFDELQKQKQYALKNIAKIDKIFDSIDALLEKHPEAESPSVEHIRNRAHHFRQIVYDKSKPFLYPNFGSGPLKIPQKLKTELDEFEIKAQHLESLANEIEAMAR